MALAEALVRDITRLKGIIQAIWNFQLEAIDSEGRDCHNHLEISKFDQYAPRTVCWQACSLICKEVDRYFID